MCIAVLCPICVVRVRCETCLPSEWPRFWGLDIEGLSLVLSGILVAICVVSLISILSPLAPKLGLVDRPSDRKRHGQSVPVVGGLAIYLSVVLTQTLLNFSDDLSWLLIPSGVIVVIGALDDAFDLGVKVRLLSQIFVAGFTIWHWSLWIHSFDLDMAAIDGILEFLAIPATLIAVVGLTNAFNMADGIDGLAAGHMLIGLLTLGASIVLTEEAVVYFKWLFTLGSAVFAFALINLSLTPLNRVFLGDSGSLFLGFVLAWTLIYYTQEPVALVHPVIAIWCVTVPVYDTVSIICWRLKNKRSPFSADRAHLHYRLEDIGMTRSMVLKTILIASMALNAFGVWLTLTMPPLVSLSYYLGFLLVFAYCVLYVSSENLEALKRWVSR